MAMGMAGLVAGLWGGLLRLGWDLPIASGPLVTHHGPLMVGGFLGTLIGLERAVALGSRWAYAAPLLSGLGGLALAGGAPGHAAPVAVAAGSLVVTIGFGILIGRGATLFLAIMAAGSVSWLVGNVLWVLGWPVYHVVHWWLGFLVLTIAGERLELSRLVRISPARQACFVSIVGVLLLGFLLGGLASQQGARVSGAALIGLTAWLALHDLARRTIHFAGLPRFIAACVLSGYVWLAASGAIALIFGPMTSGIWYDAALHAAFLGFVFAMIFGHAPIIFPAVLGVAVPFRSAFYAHLLVLHLSLAARIYGDLTGSTLLRQWSGALNALVIFLFLANTARSVLLQKWAERGLAANVPDAQASLLEAAPRPVHAVGEESR